MKSRFECILPHSRWKKETKEAIITKSNISTLFQRFQWNQRLVEKKVWDWDKHRLSHVIVLQVSENLLQTTTKHFIMTFTSAEILFTLHYWFLRTIKLQFESNRWYYALRERKFLWKNKIFWKCWRVNCRKKLH